MSAARRERKRCQHCGPGLPVRRRSAGESGSVFPSLATGYARLRPGSLGAKTVADYPAARHWRLFDRGQRNSSHFEPSLWQLRSPVPGNGISRAEKNAPIRRPNHGSAVSETVVGEKWPLQQCHIGTSPQFDARRINLAPARKRLREKQCCCSPPGYFG